MSPLVLPGDDRPPAPPLEETLATADAGPAEIVRAIAAAAIPIAQRLALAALPGDPAAPVGRNETGDTVKALDQAAHELMIDALSHAPIAQVVSEEAAEPIRLSDAGTWDVVIDPIDGSGSIGIGAPLGLLFGIFPAAPHVLRQGREMVAAGYVSFGHSTDIGLSFGDGVRLATLDPRDGTFRLRAEPALIKPTTKMIAWNASNHRHFAPGLRRYFDEALAGADGPRGENTNMRWIAAAVGDLHRILLKGGVFLYPDDARPGYDKGHLRLLYEAFPIAFLIEQAGGRASDGHGDILDRSPAEIHEKTPLIFGASREVATIERHQSH
ncbi:class 1 fructose-bisphosphatase [Pelagovum pacificum]|uniref:Fructose-1,6-bisphosphatase class 1 n=1 Tax=Pelagovum pacificum TaxID=2588711 RepID=A0A5C5GDU3_9RHOB|nr:class 1 fructose-bisphosphatase [Pelagovum pacificum]QQA41431.1 fructose-1,6-bisphosphatase [Pelagovum pacificum]TNY31766.1 fructose-1,6-bisphosphatase [Pelagovum pacificum]